MEACGQPADVSGVPLTTWLFWVSNGMHRTGVAAEMFGCVLAGSETAMSTAWPEHELPIPKTSIAM